MSSSSAAAAGAGGGGLPAPPLSAGGGGMEPTPRRSPARPASLPAPSISASICLLSFFLSFLPCPRRRYPMIFAMRSRTWWSMAACTRSCVHGTSNLERMRLVGMSLVAPSSSSRSKTNAMRPGRNSSLFFGFGGSSSRPTIALARSPLVWILALAACACACSAFFSLASSASFICASPRTFCSSAKSRPFTRCVCSMSPPRNLDCSMERRWSSEDSSADCMPGGPTACMPPSGRRRCSSIPA
mmetsp:Transcript_35285/g.111515  ORF Transcript_35285/g.111515 Transcript_35285/m.111515 type:complete len:243 (-) Transcript_35285:264-992(-)